MENPSPQTTSLVNDFLSDWYDFLIQKVIATTGELLRPKLTIEEFHQMDIGRNFDIVAFAAEGLYDWNRTTADEVVICICNLFDILFASPCLNNYEPPHEFYQIPIGNLILRARLWASGQLSGFTVEFVSPRDLKISLTEIALFYLISWDSCLFWRLDLGQPYWACIPAYEGDIFLAKAKDFILLSSTNTASQTFHIPNCS